MGCNHNNINCGCKDNYLTTPPACPTPVDCPDVQPCSEVFDAQCIQYTGVDVLCNTDVVVTQNTSVAQAIEDIVTYFCAADTNLFLLNPLQCSEDPLGTISQAGTPVNQAIEDVVAYFCNAIANIPIPNLWLNITADTGTTTANTPTDTLNIVGGNDITTSIVGDTVTIDYTGSGGLPPWQVVNPGGIGLNPFIEPLSPNTRVIYRLSAAGVSYAEFSVPAPSTVGSEIEILITTSGGPIPIYVKPPLNPQIGFVNIWQAGGSLSASTVGLTRLLWSPIEADTNNLHLRLLCIASTGGGTSWVVIEQTWNDQIVSVVPA